MSKTRIVSDVLKSTPSNLWPPIIATLFTVIAAAVLCVYVLKLCSSFIHFAFFFIDQFDYGYILARISHQSSMHGCRNTTQRVSIIFLESDIHSFRCVDKFISLDFSYFISHPLCIFIGWHKQRPAPIRATKNRPAITSLIFRMLNIKFE